MRTVVLFVAGLGTGAAGVALAAGCAALLGVDDVGYRTTDASTGDAPDAPATDGATDSQDACTRATALLFADFDQGNPTTGYAAGQLTTIFTPYTGFGDLLQSDSDASISPPSSLYARGGNAFVYRTIPLAWLDGGLTLEGDVRVETEVDAGTTQAELIAIHFTPADGGFLDSRASSASLTTELQNGAVQLRLLVTGGDAGDVPVGLVSVARGSWVHARLSLAPADAGDFEVTLDVAGTKTPDAVHVLGNEVVYVGWGVNRREFGTWRVRIDNACAHP